MNSDVLIAIILLVGTLIINKEIILAQWHNSQEKKDK